MTLAHPRSDIAGAPATTVLLVDDAQRLDPEQLAALAQRVDRAEAPTVVACRPWPSQPVLHDITRSLERSQSAIVLGHITAGELHAGAHAAGRPLAPSCVSSIIELTGGITWLVLHALAVHDEIDCEADREHRGISDALQDAIAHRLLSVDADLRHAVEIVSVAPPGAVAPILSDRTDLVLAGYAEGVLAHNGQAVPVVRSAVRATMPVERLVRAGFETGHLDLTDDLLFSHLAAGDGSRVAAALLKQGDAAIASDPQRAATLYARAEEAGADPTTVGIRKAEAAWAIGDIDRASSLLDALDVDESSPVREKAVDLAAAVWAARGSMEMSRAVYISASQPD
ncbi:MAG TPA: hypothetical protein VFY91_00595, partial [Microbacterium sp.]|nr:hypothetical protein [Microbacterium sp.]